jgi:1-acyl-sn-glycerol-3-phosphate acyltransferase
MERWKLEPARDLGLPLKERVRCIRREPGMLDGVVHLAWSSFVTIYLRGYHRLAVEGRQRLPKSGPFVIVANHCSHLDAPTLALAVPWRLRGRAFPVAAGDTFFSTPLSGLLSAFVLNALPMWRRNAGPHALADLRERLVCDRCILIVFPEGTRSRTGAMAAFKAGLGMLVAATDVPVVPCRLIGTHAALPPERRWPRPLKVRLRIGNPLTFAATGNDREGWQSVAKAAESAVAELGEPMDRLAPA